jgi:Mg/Co/Ni transporter MgtE
VRALAEGKGPDTPVRDVMTQEVLYCFEDDDFGAVSSRMGELKVRRLPVLNADKRLIGLFSLGEILQAGDDYQTRVQDEIGQFQFLVWYWWLPSWSGWLAAWVSADRPPGRDILYGMGHLGSPCW